MNKLLKNLTCAALSLMVAATFTVSAAAWGENPAEDESAAVTTAAETTAEETTAEETTAEETTTEEVTTKAPDIVLDGDEEPEVTEPAADEEAEETTAAETEAPETEPETVTATAAATEAAPANTVAPDSYDAVEPFEMYVPEVLNVRGGPGTSYDKLGMVYANNTIRIIGTSGEWYVFDYYGADGYLLAELLSEVPQTTPATAAPEEDEPETEPEDVTEPVDDGEDDMVIDDTQPAETVPVTEEPPVQTTTEEEDEEDDTPAGTVTDKENKGGIPPVLLALICSVAAFVLIGVVPVLVHKAHHKKLYQY